MSIIFKIFVSCVLYYVLTLIISLLSCIRVYFSQKITSQEELEQIVKEEAARLGITIPITATLLSEFNNGGVRKAGDGYEILVGGFAAKRSVIKHEMYHIHKKDMENNPNLDGHWLSELREVFIEQPRANLYDVFGIKL